MPPINGAPSMVELRRATRDVRSMPVIVALEGYRLTVPCQILDMSATGARLRLLSSTSKIQSADQLPDNVVIVLTIDRVEVSGAIKWRDRGNFGVRFVSSFNKTDRLSRRV